ncbi:super-infection exclusion protein B, partial [Candidatus Bipolaricaulota bacterium]|nr:super-infection exclusion protein B [Candidatus Bipolaricaulota bacterium]
MSKFLDILKAIQLPPRFLLAASALGLLFLLMPVSWAQWLHIQGVLEDGRGWIALGTACAFAFGIAQLVPAMARLLRRRAAIRMRLKSLDSLSDGERILLGYCASRCKRTVL